MSLRREAVLVLRVEPEQREAPVAIELRLRREPDEVVRRVAQKGAQVGKRVDAQAEGRVYHVVLVVLDQASRLHHVLSAHVHEIVLEAEHVLHQADVDRALRPEPLETTNVDVTHDRPAGHEGPERLRCVGLDLLANPRAAEAEADSVERRRREHFPVLAGEELVARHEGPRELRIVRRQELLRIVEGVAAKKLTVVSGVVDAPLEVVLVQPLVERKVVDRKPLPERGTVGAREFRQIWGDGRIHAHDAGRQNAESRGIVRHDGRNRLAETLDERLVSRKEEQAILR